MLHRLEFLRGIPRKAWPRDTQGGGAVRVCKANTNEANNKTGLQIIRNLIKSKWFYFFCSFEFLIMYQLALAQKVAEDDRHRNKDQRPAVKKSGSTGRT